MGGARAIELVDCCLSTPIDGVLQPTFFILTALADQPVHGYGVMPAVRQLSDGRLNLRPGTRYAALDRLTEEGLLGIDREEAVDGRPALGGAR